MIRVFGKLYKNFMEHKLRYLIFLICLSFENILKDYLFSDYLRSVTTDLLSRSVMKCFQHTVMYIVLAVICFLGMAAVRMRYIVDNNSMECSMRKALLARFSTMQASSWRMVSAGGMMENLNGDVERATGPFKNDILDIFDALASVMIAFVVLVRISWILAASCLGIGMLCGSMTRIFSRQMKAVAERRASDREAVTGFFMAFCEGARTIKRFGCLSIFQQKHADVSDRAFQSVCDEAKLKGRVFMARDLGRLMTEGGIIAVGAVLAIATGSISLSEVMFVSGMGYSLYYGVNVLLGLSSVELKKAQVSAERILERLSECNDNDFTDTRQSLEDEMWALSVKNLSFAYGDAENVLDHCSFDMKKGSIGVIIGPSGCGKSTLLKIIAGVLDGYTGSVQTKRTSYVPQIGALYDATIAQNIAFDTEYDITRVEECAKLACVHESIADHESGYLRCTAHNGTDFSAGQLQRISIARGLYPQSDLLLLDEMTSGLDSALRNEMLALVKSLAGEKTILMVSHDSEVIRQADVIFEMKNGKIFANTGS